MTDITAREEKRIEARARRAAKKVGLMVRKSRRWTIDERNLGGLQLFDPYRNWVVLGETFDLSAEYILDFCGEGEEVTQ